MKDLRILIAGGGIGGLTAAAALERLGFAVTLLERAAELRAVGAGLTLQPNAIAALRSVGLAEGVVAAGHRSGVATIRKPDGRVISQIDLAAAWPQEVGITLHRATLHHLLRSALTHTELVLGATVCRYEDGGGQVRVHLEDGRSFEGDLLIGADGIRSAIRRQLFGDGEPLYAGYYCWRGIGPQVPKPLEGLSETWGRGQRFGLVPIDGERIYWFAVVNGAAGGSDDEGTLHGHLQNLFGSWHEPIAEVIAATPASAILRGDILYRKPVPVWGRGRVTLLGDAAHPMTPDFGQGACQAIEDAVILAAVLRQENDPVLALRRYETQRQPRTAAIVRSAATFGRVAQWQNPLLCGLRDSLNSLVPQRVLEREVSRLWRFPGPV